MPKVKASGSKARRKKGRPLLTRSLSGTGSPSDEEEDFVVEAVLPLSDMEEGGGGAGEDFVEVGGDEAEEEADVVYVVVRQPFAPQAWYERNKGVLALDVCSPASMFAVEAVFSNEAAARTFVTDTNIEDFVEQIWRREDAPDLHDSLLAEATALAAEEAGVEAAYAPPAAVHTHFVGLVAYFLANYRLKKPIAEAIDDLGGGLSYSAVKVFRSWPLHGHDLD